MDELRFDVYGRFVVRVVHRRGEWVAEIATGDGKRQRLTDVVIPPEATAGEIADVLEAVFHECGGRGGRIRLLDR